MKLFAKFLLVVTAISAVACSADIVDETTAVGNKTTISVSLQSTRTSLGEKGEESYPLYWSEGDRIAINGTSSEEAVINLDNRSSAQFTFNATLSHPYAITYPYTTSTSAETAVVPFAAEQNYVENSTESGILPMYGYATSGNSIKLNHLAAILRFPIKANKEGVTLSKIVITSASESLAGNFIVDCTNGSLTPSSNATNVVTYNLSEDFVLSTSTESVLYIALPAGETGSCTVEFIEKSGEKMTASWSDKELKAGVVREFKSIIYQRGTNANLEYLTTEEDHLIIYRNISGVVKETNGNPIEGVAVSDGFSVTHTNAMGYYSMNATSDAWYIYITVPAEYQIDTNEKNLPCFYQKYDPKQRTYDFTLTPLAGGVEQKFALVVMTDIHTDLDYSGKNLFANSVIPHINKQYESLEAQGIHCYGINLGDYLTNHNSIDSSNLRQGFLESLSGSKVKFFSVFGNHDFTYFNKSNPLTADERNSTYNLKAQREHEEMFGPVNYSVDRGNVHIVAMRNTQYTKNNHTYSTAYDYGFTDEQVEWLIQDLSQVPTSKTILFCIHVPFFNYTYTNYAHVREVLNRFDKVHILSGHNHYNRNITHSSFSAHKSSKFVEHNTCSVSGPVWEHIIAGDGSPQGYRVFINEGGEMTHSYYLGWNENDGKNLLGESKQMRLYWGDAKFGAPISGDNPYNTKGYYGFNFSNADGKKVLLANLYNAGNTGWTIDVYENDVKMGSMTKLTYEKPAITELIGDGSFANPFRLADGVISGHDFYYEGYALGKMGRKTSDDGVWQACFHMYSYTLNDNNAKIKVVATDPYGDVYTEEVLLGDTTF